MSPRSWREQDPGDSRSQRRAESGGGGSREAAGSERQRDLRGREAATQQEPDIEQVLDKG